MGRVLNGRFRVESTLGEGGMGKVYRATQLPLERVVALKVLNPNFPEEKDPNFKRRFLLEASMTAKLRHPNTVSVIDYGQTDDGVYFIAMELLQGRPLSELLSEEGPLPWPRAFQIAQQICRSLREAHGLGIVHRDLKPANVMLSVDEDGHDVVKVLDFGLVKSFQTQQDVEVTQAGMFLGSPQYMAPEQARAQADPRSDVYSLGVLLFQMICGRTPFVGQDYLDLIVQHLKEAPPSPRALRPDLNIPPPVEALVLRCLAKEPAGRFQTMDALLDGMRLAARQAGLSGAGGLGFSDPMPLGPTPPPQGIPPPPPAETLEDGVRTQALRSHPPGGRQKKKRPLFLRVTLVAGLAFVGVFLLLNHLTQESVPTPTLVTAPVPPPPPPAQSSESPAGKPVVFHVSSEPEGARVFIGTREMGTTPTVFDLPAGADGRATAELIFVLPGYPVQGATAGGSGDVVLLEKLQKRAVLHVPLPMPEADLRRPARPESSSPVISAAEFHLPNLPGPSAPTPAGAPAAKPAEPAVPASATVTAAPKSAKPAASAAPAPSPESPADPNVPRPFADGMTRPMRISEPAPLVYTHEAIATQAEGVMIIRCVITVTGTVDTCRTLKTVPAMEEAVVAWLKSQHFKPAEENGRPVAVDYLFPPFHLKPPPH
jgi:serine/threonine-protein kinase